jgi:protein-S-isoprenylcysteine O-methyltransferase Ste14
VSAVGSPVSERSPRTAADWFGFVFFCAFALFIPLTSGRLGLMLLPPMLYEVAVAATFLVRNRARRTLPGVGPRSAAYAATFLIPLFIWVSSRWAPSLMASTEIPSLRMAGTSVWLFGAVISFWPIWYLRRSFSVEPAARELETSGPYSFARHPIYATHLLEYGGIWLLHATIPFGVVLMVWLIVLRIRIGYEERVLSDAFPEYTSYRQRVGAFGPRLRVAQAANGG